jgi:hypothetical protein
MLDPTDVNIRQLDNLFADSKCNEIVDYVDFMKLDLIISVIMSR